MNIALSDEPHTIAVWQVDLNGNQPPDWAVLDPRERAVADAFVHSADRERYGRTHCALRVLLSDLLDVAPIDVPLLVGSSGKPFLADARPRVSFNLSHSRNTALIAIGRAAEIGVDIEDDDAHSDFSELIDIVFDKETAERLHREEPQQRRHLFLRGWTRKEAVAKALGSGFLIDPKHFIVPLDDATPWKIRLHHYGVEFVLSDLSSTSAVAALAVVGFNPRVVVRQYDLERDRLQGERC